MTTNPIYNFNNKTAIVTGAGGGMGKEIVLALSKFCLLYTSPSPRD